MKKEKCIEIVRKFINDVLDKRENLLFDYCLIKNAYSRDEYMTIKKLYPELNDYYEFLKIKETENFFENQKGDGDRTVIAKAIYYLLWENSKVKIDCEFYNNEITKITGKENIEYEGDTLNTRDLIFGMDNRKLVSYCKGEISEYYNLKFLAEQFRLKYETLGNFMPCPVAPKDISININRCKILGDRFDLYLEEVQKFFYKEIEKEVENRFIDLNKYNDILRKKIKDSEYVSQEFYEILKANKKYFELYETFDNFVKDNYLDDYVIENKVWRLLHDERRLDELNYNDIIKYIRKAIIFINKRARRMEKELIKKLLEYRIEEIAKDNQTIMKYKDDFKNIMYNGYSDFSQKGYDEMFSNFLNSSEKFYMCESDNYENLESCIEDVLQNNFLKNINNSKCIYIKFYIGKNLIDKTNTNQFIQGASFITESVNANCRVIFDTLPDKKYMECRKNDEKIKLVIIATGI